MGIARLTIGFFLLLGSPVLSHEFWIEAEQYQVESGEPLTADLKNGENFAGVSLAWFENRFSRFEIVLGDNTNPVDGRMGDTPALQTRVEGDGLLVILHETTPSTVTYREWEKFLKFAEHKDFPEAASTHKAKGWSMERFREGYTRHAKALVALGSGKGSDRAFGLATEFVALTNPYALGFDGEMRVALFYQNTPRPDAQVEVFERAPDGAVTVSLHRTDAAGEAVIPVVPGHVYLFDAVVLRPSPKALTTETAPVWETLWAALTFSVPDQ